MRMRGSSVFGNFLRIIAILLALAARQTGAETTIVHAGWLLAEPGSPPLRRQSVIIENDRILEVRSGFVQPSALGEGSRNVRVIDLAQDYVLPGLIDSHVHLQNASMSLGRLDLRPATSRDDLLQKNIEVVQQVLGAEAVGAVGAGIDGDPDHLGFPRRFRKG